MSPHIAVSGSLLVPVKGMSHEGVTIQVTERFKGLYRSDEKDQLVSDGLENSFVDAIEIEATILPVGQKVDIHGRFKTLITGTCDSCTGPVKFPINSYFDFFLMPSDQFSKHDKPGGKVIHPPTKDRSSSRHPPSKAPVLTDAEGEHEDVNFGSYDGETVDLRFLIREQLILEIPMIWRCKADCQGLCIQCGENINLDACHCEGGPKRVTEDTDFEVPMDVPWKNALKEKVPKK